MLHAQARYSKVPLRLDAAETTAEGYLRCVAPVTKAGVFPYKNDDGSWRYELRPHAEVHSKASLDSLKMKPIQVDHRAMLDASNVDRFKVGHMGEAYEVDGDVVRIPITVDGKAGLDAVASGKKELSMGYECDLEPAPRGSTYDGKPYTHVQRNIRYNHLAIVDRARLGSDLRLDSVEQDGEVPNTLPPPKETTMSANLRKISLDGIEYEAAPEVINALTKANQAVTTEKGRADSAESALATAKSNLQKAEGERDGLKTELAQAKKDNADLVASIPAKAAQMAKDRAEVDAVARKVLVGDAFEKSVALDIPGLKKAVVAARYPKATLDGMDAAKLDGMFEAVKVSVQDGDPDAEARNRERSAPRFAADRNDGGEDPVEKARLKAEKAREDAWKNPTGSAK